MESLDFFDLLSRETFELCQSLTPQNPFESSSPIEKEIKSESQNCEEQKIGLLYRLDKGSNTFCIRGVISEDINTLMSQLKNDSSADQSLKKELFHNLKISNPLELNDLNIFYTSSMELAEVIFDHIIGRRFPYNEEMLCNLSDPGFSWWMDVGFNRFQIYFKSHGIERSEKLIRLGPIGDASVAIKHLSSLCDYLGLIFPINEISCSDKSFAIGTSQPDSVAFLHFRDLFWQGKNNTFFNDDTPHSIPISVQKTINLYFKEISAMRTFWIEIQKKLRF